MAQKTSQRKQKKTTKGNSTEEKRNEFDNIKKITQKKMAQKKCKKKSNRK